jgi:ferritin
MISKKMAKAINKQINAELYSSYLYFAMSSQAAVIGLKGLANWMYVQTKEEMTHALKFCNYLSDQGEQALMEAIGQPPTSFKSPLHMFEETLKHEKIVTSRINELANLAAEEKDHATAALLQWYITEQVEEEKNATEIIALLKMAGDNKGALIMLDKDLAARTFVPPPGMTTL